MRRYLPFLVTLLTTSLLGYWDLSLSAEKTVEGLDRVQHETVDQPLWRERPSQELLIFVTGTLPASESDRGCCVWKTPNPKCAYSNRTYCASKAKQANVEFEFYKDKTCKAVPVCQ